MTFIQILIIVSGGAVLSGLTLRLLHTFGRNDLAIYFLTPILIYCLGFGLRVSETQKVVDIGYFFTEGAFIFIYTIFALTFLLGQLKYWKNRFLFSISLKLFPSGNYYSIKDAKQALLIQRRLLIPQRFR